MKILKDYDEWWRSFIENHSLSARTNYEIGYHAWHAGQSALAPVKPNKRVKTK